MSQARAFYPPRLPALLIQGSWLVLLLIILPVSLFFSLRASQIWQIVAGMGLTLLTALGVLHMAYQIYALTHAAYTIKNNALYLQWGLRQEIIPASDIQWVRPLSRLPQIRPKRWPLMGVWRQRRSLPNLGRVEFMAGRGAPLLAVGCHEKVFVISPQKAAAFTETLRKMLETGSLHNRASASFYPGQLPRAPLHHPLARFLWTFTLALNLGLLFWVSSLIPQNLSLPNGYNAYGLPLPAVSIQRLLWLPVTSLVVSLADWLMGLLLYIEPERRGWAWFLWSAAALQSLLYLPAFYLLLTHTL